MSRGASSSGWPSDNAFNYTDNDEQYEANYGPDTRYTVPVGAQYFSEFNQAFSTSQETIPTPQSTQRPFENLSLHELEQLSWPDHSNFNSSRPITSSNYRSPNL